MPLSNCSDRRSEDETSGTPVRLVCALAIILWPIASSAGPWLEAGDSALRHDIQILSDAGVITSPVSTWPLAWGDIAHQLDYDGELRDYQLSALQRVRKAAGLETETHVVRLHARVGYTNSPKQVRTFENTLREEGEIEGGASWTGERFAFRAQVSWVNDPLNQCYRVTDPTRQCDVGDEWRADGSYLGVALGNWTVAASLQDRWWGPSWQSSLILSNNARPIPAITLERNSTQAFRSKWLRWIGTWDLSVMYGFLEKEREIPDAHFFGMRVNFRPLKSLEIGLSRTAIWCGDGRPCSFSTFVDLLLGQDNQGDNVSPQDEPGNQLAGIDIRWSAQSLGLPVALYTHWIGEDETNFLPTQYMATFGTELWGQWGGSGTYRLYLEWSDTECDFRAYGDGNPDCAYNHPIYQSGYRYKGRSIGHTGDGDSSIFTLGGVVAGAQDNSWTFTLGYGKLNRRHLNPVPDRERNFFPPDTDYGEVELLHKRPLPIGDISLGVGYQSFDSVDLGKDDDFRVSAEWKYTY